MLINRACCFCGTIIDRTDHDAVEIVLTNLWKREGVQGLQAHSICCMSVFPAEAMVDPACLSD